MGRISGVISDVGAMYLHPCGCAATPLRLGLGLALALTLALSVQLQRPLGHLGVRDVQLVEATRDAQ